MYLKFELFYKALKRSKSFNVIFITNFVLAILSLFLLQFLKGSVESSLESKAKTLLGADISISSRFPISSEQEKEVRAKIPDVDLFHKGISTVSMVSSSKRGRLMEVVKLNKNFPFYGGITFSDKTHFPGKVELPKDNQVWVYDEVLKLLNLQKGDLLKIGKENFKIQKIITADTLKSVSFSGFIPKVFLSPKGVKRSELLQFGSTARYKLNYKLKTERSNSELDKIGKELEKVLDRNLKVLSPSDGRDRLTRVLTYITDFLSLVSLVSFFLGLVGLIYLYTGFLEKHKKDINVLQDLGVRKSTILQSYLIHLLSLITISSVIVFLVVSSVVPLLAPLITKSLGFSIAFKADGLFFAQAYFALFIISICIGIPLIRPLLETKYSKAKGPLLSILSFTPFIASLLFLSNLVSPAKNIGFLFSILTFVTIAIIFFIGGVFLRKIDFSGHLESLSISLAFKNIVRQRRTTLTLFTAIFLCSTLFSLIPQVGSSLKRALDLGAGGKPRFFVIDATKADIQNLSQTVKKAGGELQNASPIIRARITKINDVDFNTYSKRNGNLELKAAQELKNRAVNVSYRKSLKKSESLIEGRDFSGAYKSPDFSKLAELSVEQRYARRRGIKIGDKIDFDILGLEIKTKVVNIRSVNWTEFVPNFFLIFQDGVINDAPNKILATISEGPYDPQELLINLSDKYPSLTIVDVKGLLDEFSKLATSIISIVDKMSLYSIFIGLLMSFIIIQYQMSLQKNNILRLKMIGIENNSLKNSLMAQFTLISSFASLLGVITGSCISYIISKTLFESYWDLRLDLVFLYIVMIPTLTAMIVGYFTRKALNQKENQLFGE